MSMKLAFLKICLILIAAVVAVGAQAHPDYLDEFLKFYNVPKGGVLDQSSCKICHVEDAPKTVRNPYGKSLRVLLTGEYPPMTDDDLTFVEKQDSDGDGYTNLEEIVSGTLPGDPSSHPSVHPTNLPKHVVHRKLDPRFTDATGGLLALGVVMSGAGKIRKKASLNKVAFGLLCVGVLTAAATLFNWFVSNQHP